MTGFSGYGIKITGPGSMQSTPVYKLRANAINNCGTGVAIGTFGGVETDIGQMNSCTNCFAMLNGSSTNGMQGNILKCNAAYSCNNGLNFDGGTNTDSNTCIFSTWDPGTLAGAIFYNSNSSGLGNDLSNWILSVENWIGNFNTSGSGYIAKGAFQFCTFRCALTLPPLVSSAYFWGLFQISGGGGNSFLTSCLGGFSSAFSCTWQATAGNRNNYTGGVATTAAENVYKNQTLCNGTVPTGGILAGAVLTTYVYSPFVDSNSMIYRAVPTNNPGFAFMAAALGSNANEIIFTWRNVSGATISAATAFDFQFIHGVP